MSDRYWNPAGAANWADANVWALTDGGDPTGIAAPTSSDNVYFTSTNINNCTVAATANCLNLDFTGGTGYTGTLAGASAMNIYGSSTLNAGMTRTYTGSITFRATATGKTITCNSVTLNSSITFLGSGGGWTLQDTLNISTKTITVTQGTFNTGGQTITAGVITNSGSSVRGITLGASTITLSSTIPWTSSGSNLTFDAGTSTINLSAGTATFTGGGLTYYNVNFTAATSVSIGGANTFTNLTVTDNTSSNSTLSISANQTITGTLTLTGASNMMLVYSSVLGTSRTLTAAAVSLANLEFRDITAAGVASPFTGTVLADALGNSNITFTTPVTRYWVGGTGSFSSTSRWSTSSGGASGASVPLCHDTAIFDSNSFTSGGLTCTIDVKRVPAIDFSGTANTPNLIIATAPGVCEIYGSLDLTGVNTFTAIEQYYFYGRSTHTIKSNGKLFGNHVYFGAVGGSYTLSDNFGSDAAATTDNLTLIAGTFDANDFNVNYARVNLVLAGAVTRILTMGNGTWSLMGVGTVWDAASAANLTINSEGSTIKFTDISATVGVFAGGDFSYNNLWFSGGTTTKTYSITGTNTFADFKDTGTIAHTIQFPDGVATTVTTLNVNGNTGQLITLSRTSAGTFTISCAAGTISCDYLSISNSVASGGATFYAGANSTDGGGNTGWIFTAPASAAARALIIIN